MDLVVEDLLILQLTGSALLCVLADWPARFVHVTSAVRALAAAAVHVLCARLARWLRALLVLPAQFALLPGS